MRIVHFLWKNTIGGAELFTLNLSIKQAFLHDIQIIYLGDDKSFKETKKKVKLIGSGIQSGFDIFGYIRLGLYIFNNNFHIIHIHQNITSVLVAIIFGRGANIVKHEHGTTQPGWKTFRQRLLSRIVSPFIDLYIANSTHTKNQLMKNEKISGEKIKIIPCGIEVKRFSNRIYERIRKQLKVSKITNLVGFIGRLHPQKGVEEFLTASELIHSKNSKTFFIIVGDGVLRKYIEKRIETSKIHDKIIMLGFREDIPDIMAALDLILITSHWEPQGIVAIEAMASGTAIVSFDVGGLPDVLGDAGILIGKRDVKTMVKNALFLLNNEDLRKQFEKKGRERAGQYDMDSVVEKVMNSYSSIISFH